LHPGTTSQAQQQALAGGVEIDIEDGRQLHIQPTTLGRAHESAQSRVFFRLDLQARLTRGHDQQFIAQPGVVLGEHGVGGGGGTQPMAKTRGHPGQPP